MLADPVVHVEAVDAEKQKIGTEAAQGFFGDGADQRKRILAQSPPR